MTRTYVDAGVLIQAARGTKTLSEPALALLCDPAREFASSLLVRLEVIPKAGSQSEVDFYETYFKQVSVWAPLDGHLWTSALEESRSSGLAPLDSIHVVLAAAAGCTEFFTTELPTAPIFRTKRLGVMGLRPAAAE